MVLTSAAHILELHVRTIPLSIKKKLEKWLVLGLAKEVSKRSLRYLVLPKNKDTIKDSHVKDHKSQLKGDFIDKR